MSKRIHVHLDDEIVLKVEALALQQDRSISNMIRVLLKEALADRKIPTWYQKNDLDLTRPDLITLSDKELRKKIRANFKPGLSDKDKEEALAMVFGKGK